MPSPQNRQPQAAKSVIADTSFQVPSVSSSQTGSAGGSGFTPEAWCMVLGVSGTENGRALVKARIYEHGVTDVDTGGNDFYPGLAAEVGYGTSSDISDWKWTRADYTEDYVPGPFDWSNDEVAAFVETREDNINAGYRFRLVNPATGHESDALYCGAQGVEAKDSPGASHWIVIESGLLKAERLPE